MDGHVDRYLVEYSKTPSTGLVVVYLHSGLYDADQAFCSDTWCSGHLRDVVMDMGGTYISPDLRGDNWMNSTAESDLMEIVRLETEDIKDRKIILAGVSMGASGALVFAGRHPDLVRGVIALCPATDMSGLYDHLINEEGLFYDHIAKSIATAYGATPDEMPDIYRERSAMTYVEKLEMPVVITHGAKDRIVPVSHSSNLATRLEKAGRAVKYIEYPDGSHQTPIEKSDWPIFVKYVIDNGWSAL